MIMFNKLRLYCERSLMKQCIEVFMCDYRPNGKIATPKPIIMEETAEIGDGHAPPMAPILELQKDAAQELMDELWRCGVRPSDGQASDAQIAAMEKHLDDMRTLIAVKFEVPFKIKHLEGKY